LLITGYIWYWYFLYIGIWNVVQCRCCFGFSRVITQSCFMFWLTSQVCLPVSKFSVFFLNLLFILIFFFYKIHSWLWAMWTRWTLIVAMLWWWHLQYCSFYYYRHRRRGGGREGIAHKIGKRKFLGQILCKIQAYFGKFSYIYLRAKMSCSPKVDWAPMTMPITITMCQYYWQL